MMRRALIASALLAAGCSRSEAPGLTQTEPARDASPGADAALPANTPAPTAAASTAGPRTWAGTYKTAPGTLYVPEDWKVRWRPDDAEAGVGEGALTLSIDEAAGAVRGRVEGPIGPALVDGTMADGGLAARITRSDPHDHGFSGVIIGRASGDKIEGTINVSPATAGAVRTGTFSVSPAGTAARP
jgi:hypothetical protein